MRHLFFQNKISGLEAFNASVAAQASGAQGVADVAGAGHYGRWTGNLARDVRRVFLKHVDKPNVYWARMPYRSGQDSDVVPFPLSTRSACKSRREERGIRAIPQQLCGVKRNFCAKHGIKDDLTLGLGLHRDGVAHQKRKTVVKHSWNVLGSHSAERYLFGLVRRTRGEFWDS